MFFSTQVYLLMDRLVREYKLEEGDPCSKLIETESLKRLEAMRAIVQSYNEDKDSIATGLLEVKRNADSFLSVITPTSSERTDVTFDRVESQVKEVQEQLRAQEQQVLDVWNVRRTLAEYCLQYLELEQCAKEVRSFLMQHPLCYNPCVTIKADSRPQVLRIASSHARASCELAAEWRACSLAKQISADA